MSKTYETGPYPGGQIMDMTKTYSLLHVSHMRNFPGKTEGNKSIQISLKYSISISLLSSLITLLPMLMKFVKNQSAWPDPRGQRRDVKNISNWPDPGCQMMDMTQNYSLYCMKVIFLEKLKTTKAHKYA